MVTETRYQNKYLKETLKYNIKWCDKAMHYWETIVKSSTEQSKMGCFFKKNISCTPGHVKAQWHFRECRALYAMTAVMNQRTFFLWVDFWRVLETYQLEGLFFSNPYPFTSWLSISWGSFAKRKTLKLFFKAGMFLA